MKTLVVLLIVFVFLTLLVTGVKATVNFTQLQEDIDLCPYNTSDYVLKEFDCSNMAAQLHDHLEATGNYDNVYLVLGGGNGSAHAWVQCDGVWVEATAKKIMTREWCDWIMNRYPNLIVLKDPIDCLGHKDKHGTYDCMIYSQKGLKLYNREFLYPTEQFKFM